MNEYSTMERHQQTAVTLQYRPQGWPHLGARLPGLTKSIRAKNSSRLFCMHGEQEQYE